MTRNIGAYIVCCLFPLLFCISTGRVPVSRTYTASDIWWQTTNLGENMAFKHTLPFSGVLVFWVKYYTILYIYCTYRSRPVYDTQNIRFRKKRCVTLDVRQQNIVRTSSVNFSYEQPNYFSKGVNSASLSQTKLLPQDKIYIEKFLFKV